MKKILLSLALAVSFGSVQAQNIYSFGFDGTTATMEAAGWMRTNQSTPSTTTLWTIASYTPVVVGGTQTPLPFTDVATPTGQTSNPPNGQAGGQNSFALVNFTSTSGTGTISNWLISPVITVDNGGVVTFYTRIGKNNATAASFADRLQLRMSTNGAATANPAGGSASLGDFTTLLADVNPNLNLTDYPTTWTQITSTISGLSGPTPVKFAFRYFVTSGGPNGNNSDIIGIDTFSVDNALSTDSFFKSNFALYPNPTNGALNIASSNGIALTAATITDVNGRVVAKESLDNLTSTGMDVSALNSGVYFISVESAEGKGTAKFIKI